MTNNETVLRQNCADLQAQLAAANVRQAEIVAELAQLRAEKAAALEQKPVAFWWIGPDGKDNGGPYRGMASEFAIDNARNMGCEPQLLYAAPVPNPATVPDEWRKALQECADDLAIELDMRYQSRHQYPSERRKYDNEMQLVIRARALLQSAQEPKPYGYKYRVKDAFGHEVIVDDNRGRPILETIPLYAAPVPTPATAPDESQLQKAANHQYDKDTLKALYQAWEMLPCCNLMAAIGGAIQDIQAMQSAQEPRS